MGDEADGGCIRYSRIVVDCKETVIGDRVRVVGWANR
jgi:hypothetical protein